MARDFRSARFWAQEVIEEALFPGARAVDATMGNGYDTEWLCTLVGEAGQVYAFDVQADAVARTDERLRAAGLRERATLLLCGHEHMLEKIDAPVDVVMFNLGWLPGAEHGVTTQTETTLQAVSAALELINEDGLVSICIYPGHEEGTREKHALLGWAEALDERRYDALLKTYLNQSNAPPQLLLIKKKKTRKGKLAREA